MLLRQQLQKLKDEAVKIVNDFANSCEYTRERIYYGVALLPNSGGDSTGGEEVYRDKKGLINFKNSILFLRKYEGDKWVNFYVTSGYLRRIDGIPIDVLISLADNIKLGRL